MMDKKEFMRQQLLRLAFLIVSLILINLASGYLSMRIDLTADKRYTLSSGTEEIIGQLDDVVYIRVYLDGDLPAGFRRMRNATRELLDEFLAM